MIFYKSPLILALLAAVILIHVFSLMFDQRIKCCFLKIAYLNFPIHIFLFFALLNEGASLTELSCLLMFSIFAYLVSYEIKNDIASIRNKRSGEDNYDV